jgi:hypothetical protein
MKEVLGELTRYPVTTPLLLTGTLIVARDMAHAKLKERLDAGEELPQYFKDHPVYYAGPAKTPEGYASGSFGPTTAGRMDSYVDQFQAAGLRAWGPTQQAAQFESSKIFSQEFMDRNGIPTMQSASFADADGAKSFASSLDGKCAVKADGLALGKGVLICNNTGEATGAIDQIMTDRAFGEAGSSVLIQELITGMEVSLHALCDGKCAKLFPSSQDHKRALDGDKGLNTGGMGTYSPAPFLSEKELQQYEAETQRAGA